jgi:hypothetical protein
MNAKREGTHRSDAARGTVMKKAMFAAIAALALGAGDVSFGSRAFAQAAAPAPDAAAPAADAAAAPADATAKKVAKKMAKKKVKAAAKVTVVITNNSGLGLMELDVAMSGQAESTKVAGPLAAGKKASATIAHDKACLFDIHGSYDDGSTVDSTGVDLCKDKQLNLTP